MSKTNTEVIYHLLTLPFSLSFSYCSPQTQSAEEGASRNGARGEADARGAVEGFSGGATEVSDNTTQHNIT